MDFFRNQQLQEMLGSSLIDPLLKETDLCLSTSHSHILSRQKQVLMSCFKDYYSQLAGICAPFGT